MTSHDGSRALSQPPKAPPKPWFALIVVITGLVALGMMGAWEMVAYLTGFLFLGLYFVSPLLARPKAWMATNPEIREVHLDESGIPPSVAATYRSVLEKLLALGFTDHGLYHVTKHTASTTYYLAVFENQAERTLSRWLASISTVRADEPILTFTTRFADGSEIITANLRRPQFGPRPKFRKGFSFPGIDDPARLFRLHHRALAELGEFSTRTNQIEGEPIAFIRKSLTDEMNLLVKAGYYRLDEDAGVYRMTVLGSYLAMWNHFWPIGPIRRAYRRNVAARKLREWEGL